MGGGAVNTTLIVEFDANQRHSYASPSTLIKVSLSLSASCDVIIDLEYARFPDAFTHQSVSIIDRLRSSSGEVLIAYY